MTPSRFRPTIRHSITSQQYRLTPFFCNRNSILSTASLRTKVPNVSNSTPCVSAVNMISRRQLSTSTDEKIIPEPRIIIYGRALPVCEVLCDELSRNYGRNAIAEASEESLMERVKEASVDIVFIGSGFDEEYRQEIKAQLEEANPSMARSIMLSPKESHPGQMVTFVNENTVYWKCGKALGRI